MKRARGMTRKVLGLVVAAAGLGLARDPAAPAPGARSAHWKSTVTMEGARPGDVLQSAEIWLSGGRMLIEERGTSSEKINVLRTEGQVFAWTQGQSTGLKMSAGLAAGGGRPSHNFVERIDEIRARGRKTGEERVDGQPCEVYEYDSALDGKGTYWLATRLQGFPLKAILERNISIPYRSAPVSSVKLTYHNTDVQVPGKVPESKFWLPQGVRFDDAAQILMPGRLPRR